MADTPLSTQEQVSLAERIRQGDSSAENEFVRLYGDRVFVMVLARTRDPEAARDLRQEVLMAVLRALRNGQVREAERLAAFVHGTARNLLSNYWRARALQPKEEALSSKLLLVEPGNEFETLERVNLVRQVLERLDSTDRKILLMTMVEGLKPGEIANRLNLTPEVVRQRKSRSIKKVIEHIRKMSRR